MYALVTCNRCCKNSNADQDRSGKSILAPFCICPQPISRQCFSTRLLKAIFSCSLVHTGDVSCSFARSLLTCSSCRLFNRVLQKPQPNQAWHDCHEGDITHVRLNAISTSMVVTTHCTRQEPPIAIELDIGRVSGTRSQHGFQTYCNDPGSCAHRPNIEHEDFSFAQFLYLALLLTTLHGYDVLLTACNSTSGNLLNLTLVGSLVCLGCINRGGAAAATLPTVPQGEVIICMSCFDQPFSHLCSDSQQPPKQEEVDLQLCKDIR